jgi:hypothetical protein
VTAVLAAGLAWTAWALLHAPAAGASARASLDAIVLAWAAGPDASWGLVLVRLARIAGGAGLAVAFAAAAFGIGETTAALLKRPLRAGRRVRAGRRAPRRRQPALFPLAVPLALGLGVLSVAVAGLGLAGLLKPLLLRVLALATAGLGLRAARARRRALGGLPRSLAAGPVVPVVAAALALALAVALASLPDTLEDPLVYHWAAPEAFLRAGRLYAAVQHFQWHGPLAIEMLFALGLAVAGVAGLKAMNLALLAAVLAGAGALARRLDRRADGWTTVVLVALMPAVAGQAWLAKTELGVTAFWTAAAVAMLALPARSARGALLTGLLAGCCASAKYTAAFPLAGLAVWFLLRRPGLRRAVLAGLAATVVASPWAARNWLTTRDPVYPMASTLLGGLAWGPGYDAALHAYARQVSAPGDGVSSWLLACRDALAALAPLALVAFLPGAARAACVASLLAFLVLLDERNGRFLFPLVPLVAAGGELVLLAFRSARPRLAATGWSLLAALGLLLLFVRVPAGLPAEDWEALAGRLTDPALLAARYTALDDLCGWSEAHVPASSRILMTGSDKRFGFVQPVVSSHVVTMPLPWRWAKESRTPGELAKKWKQAGIGYVAHNLMSGRYRHQLWYRGPEWDERALRVYRAFALRYLTEVHHSPHADRLNGLFYLLRVEARPHVPLATVPVLPWTESVFADANGATGPVALGLARRALARLPDVDDAIEQAASAFHRLGKRERALALNRALAAAGFDGLTNPTDLPLEESWFGHRRAAFAALRHRSLRAGGFGHGTEGLIATLYLNWADVRARAGDPAGACRLLERSLLAVPDFPSARLLSGRLGCGPGRAARRAGVSP